MISEELLQSFIAEASDLLDDVEPSLVEYSRLDDVEERTEIVNRVFRHFHSIKGSAGFVGLHNIALLTHEAETLLEQFRKTPEKIIPQDNITLLCRTVDLLRAIFDSGGESVDHEGNDLGVDALIAEIVAATRAARGAPGTLFPVEDAAGATAVAAPSDATQVVSQDTAHRIADAVSESGTPGAPPAAPASPLPPRSRDRTKSITKIRTRTDLPAPDKNTVAATKRRKSDTARIIRNTEMQDSGNTKAFNSAEFTAKYVSEANELLEQIEQALLQAEQNPEAGTDAIQEAFRCLHSFKGNAGFMSLHDLERLGHRMETEVEGKIGRSTGIDSQTFDALLQMIDVLRQGVVDFSCGGSGDIPEADAYIAMMDEFSAATAVAPARASVPAPAPVSPPLPVAAPEEKDADDDTKRIARTAAAGAAAPDPVASPPPAQTKKNTDTTRLVLRGKTSTQEDLRSMPKSDNIVINTAAPDTRRFTRDAARDTARDGAHAKTPDSADSARFLSMGKGKKEVRTQTLQETQVKKDTQAAAAQTAAATSQTQRGRRNPDTAQKRRTAEQFASRNDIRVDLRKLDSMLDLVGELVIAEAMVTRHPVVWNADNESLERAVHQLRRVAGSLQDMATSVRMIPLAPTFRRMTRLVYDLSVKAGKQVDLVLFGEETEVDRTVIERISDPLVHIIRNAIDHGIEPPAERAALGKAETGRLTVEGHHEGGEVWIVITDDGRGLDKEAILNRAISKGLIQGDGSDLSDDQIYHFIFEPGFSTATKVTDISGRGFGMDVVKKNIEKLSGKINIRTRAGEGTAVVLRIPLTLAIIDGMLVRSDETRYIIPLLSIRESLRPDMSQILQTPDGQEMVKLRNELIPIVRLDETFSRVHKGKELVDGILMIVEGEDGDVVALFADELLGQQETVIKGLSGWLKKSRGVSGCTILGDGEVGLILDIGAIVRLVRQKYTA